MHRWSKGRLSGTITRIKNVAKNSISNHCFLHRYALVTKRISASLNTVLDETVQIINFIKTRPLQSRIFKALYEDMEVIIRLFFYTPKLGGFREETFL